MNRVLDWLAPFWGKIVSALAGALAVLAILERERRRGVRDERNRLQEADRARANQIRDAVDAARSRGVRSDDIRYRD